MKLYLQILIFICFSEYAFTQDCTMQKYVLNVMIEDPSLEAFFKDKDTIGIIGGFCEETDGFKAKGVEFMFKKERSKDFFKIIDYEFTDKIVYVELALFSPNVVHSALFKRKDEKLLMLNRWTTFIKSKN